MRSATSRGKGGDRDLSSRFSGLDNSEDRIISTPPLPDGSVDSDFGVPVGDKEDDNVLQKRRQRGVCIFLCSSLCLGCCAYARTYVYVCLCVCVYALISVRRVGPWIWTLAYRWVTRMMSTFSRNAGGQVCAVLFACVPLCVA